MNKKPIIVAVGSRNKTKIDPVREVFGIHFPKVKLVSLEVDSGVGEQPMTIDETYRGALNRAKKSLDEVPTADFGVGIEGGLHKYSFGWFEQSMVVIVDREGNIGVGSSGGLILPQKVTDQIANGKNLEEAVDELFGTNKIGEGIGMFGLFTKEVVTRSSGVKHGVAFALARFLHKDLY